MAGISDWLGQDIGGNKYAAGPNQTGGAGVDTGVGKTGITWADLLRGLGGSSGSSQSTPIGAVMQSQYPGAIKPPQTVPIMNINSQIPMQEEKQQGQTDWQSVAKIFEAMFGGAGIAGGASFTGAGVGTPIT